MNVCEPHPGGMPETIVEESSIDPMLQTWWILLINPYNEGEEEAKQSLYLASQKRGGLQMGIEELRQDPMMAHLIASLEKGRDIGHYGRLVFVMIARHFLSENELLEYLMKDRDVDERKARSLLAQVGARDYNPPKRERVLDWMSRQKFPICPDPADPE